MRSTAWPLAYFLVSICVSKPTSPKIMAFIGPTTDLYNKTQSSTPSPEPPSPSKSSFFSEETVPTTTMAFTFVGVVPVVGMIAFIVLKLQRRIHRKQREMNAYPRMTESRTIRSLDPAAYTQWKSELETGRSRIEMHGDGVRHEKSKDDEIKELSNQTAELGTPSYRLVHEMEGEGNPSKELEAPIRGTSR